MSKASPLMSNFNSGEFSPLLAGRADYEKYGNGAQLLENFIPLTQGPLTRRGGTVFAGQVRGNTDRVLLVPFTYSATQAYVLEFTGLAVRFWTWDAATKVRGLLMNGANPLEVATPYTRDELYAADGTPALRWAQSGDFLYLCHGNHKPRLLKRTTATSFVLEEYNAKGGPWRTLNDSATTVVASGETGTVTLTASAGIFNAGHVGCLFLLEAADISTVKPWEVDKPITVGERRRSDSKTYEALNGGTTATPVKTGTNRPVHTEGAVFDGDSGIQWAFRDPGYGYGRITSVASATTATMQVIDRLPKDVTTGSPTKRWQFGEWCPAFGWPTDVCFFRERLWFGRKQQVWGSVSADFGDFSNRNMGQVTDDMAISVELASGRVNNITWMAPDKDLVIGTGGGEFGLGELSNGDPMSPSNRRVAVLSQFGSRGIVPIKNAESLLFVTRSGLKARETRYDFGSDAYSSTDLTVLGEHITVSGLTQIAFCADPDQIVWACRADGRLVGLTWNNEQQVRGWHGHDVGGKVLSLCTIPAAEGDRDELWIVVERTIGGQVRRYVEYLSKPFAAGDDTHRQVYSDCAAVVAVESASDTFPGFLHLAGQTVSVLADGAVHPDRVVAPDGSIELQLPARTVVAGLPYVSRWRSMPIEAGARDGTAQGKTKRTSSVTYRFYNTGSAKVGAGNPGGKMDRITFRSPSDAMDEAVPLFKGDERVVWPDGYNTEGTFALEVDQPVACTLVAVLPQVSTQDAR